MRPKKEGRLAQTCRKAGSSSLQALHALEPRHLLSAIPITDLQITEGEDYQFGLPTVAHAGSGAIYFAVGGDPSRDSQLWKVDSSGKTLVKSWRIDQDVVEGFSTPPPIGHMTTVGETLFFTTGNTAAHFELWKSDGTAGGTVMVKSFDTTRLNQGYHDPQIQVVGDRLYLLAPAPPSAGLREGYLWTSDGTPGGTQQLTTTLTSNLIGHANDLYYTLGGDLYRTTGAAPGTKVSDQAPVHPDNIAALGGDLYFLDRQNLYQYDPDGGVTQVIANIRGDSYSSGNFTKVGDALFFTGATSSGIAIFRTDGTPAGTRVVKAPQLGTSPSNFVAHGDHLYFTAFADRLGIGLWRSDGTEAGTVLVSDIDGEFGGTPISNVASVGEHIYFRAADMAAGHELWRTDGAGVGTSRVRELYPGPGGSAPRELLNVDGTLYFQAIHPLTGYGLFKLNPDDSAAPVHDYFDGGLNAQIDLLPASDGLLYFANGDWTATGRELFASGGTPEGTRMVKDIAPQAFIGSSPRYMTDVGGTVLFSADDFLGRPPNGEDLWRTSGTVKSTIMAQDLSTPFPLPPPPTYLNSFFSFAGRLYFNASLNGPGAGDYLMTSDGSPNRTEHVDTFGGTASGGSSFTPHDGALYYRSNGRLFRINSSDPDFATPLTPSNPGGAAPANALASAGRLLYFNFDDGQNGTELWRSDGTPQGTVLVKNINTVALLGSSSSDPQGFTAYKDAVYFVADDGVHGRELWKTDGTAGGTVLVKDVFPGGGSPESPASSSPLHLTAHNGLLLFTASDGAHGRELWRSDGTPEGTLLLTDINPGGAGSDPADFIAVGGRLYFTANEPTGGRELWTSDGTEQGTYRLIDLYPGPVGSNPMNLKDSDGALVFTANDGVSGPKLFKSTHDTTPPRWVSGQLSPNAANPTFQFGFSEDVGASLDAGDLEIRNVTTGATIDPATASLSYDPFFNRATWTYSRPTGGAWADGRYRVTFAAGSVTDAAGNPFVLDYPFEFQIFAADPTVDGVVDFKDLAILAQNYNKIGGMTFGQGDFNFDGNVDFNDLAILAQRYNTSLPPAPASPPVAAAAQPVVSVFNATVPVQRKKPAEPLARRV